MVDTKILADRRKDIPTLDEITTVIWTPEMGARLAIARMKVLKEQKEYGVALGVTQSTISRIEKGYLKVTEKITVAALKALLGSNFGYVVYGTNPERFNTGLIMRKYWDTRLRVTRKNRAVDSKSRIV